MLAAFLILIALICASPIAPLVDGNILIEIDTWSLAAIAAIVLVISPSIVWIQYGRLAADPITAYAEDTTSVEVTRRILADTRLG